MKGSFFCDACGAEVKGRAESCPSCGRSFLGVRCPRCGREGSAEDFKSGCPECGYMEEQKTGGKTSSADERPLRPGRYNRKRQDWPASCYWILSAVIIAGTGLTLYFWLH